MHSTVFVDGCHRRMGKTEIDLIGTLAKTQTAQRNGDIVHAIKVVIWFGFAFNFFLHSIGYLFASISSIRPHNCIAHSVKRREEKNEKHTHTDRHKMNRCLPDWVVESEFFFWFSIERITSFIYLFLRCWLLLMNHQECASWYRQRLGLTSVKSTFPNIYPNIYIYTIFLIGVKDK